MPKDILVKEEFIQPSTSDNTLKENNFVVDNSNMGLSNQNTQNIQNNISNNNARVVNPYQNNSVPNIYGNNINNTMHPANIMSINNNS